MHDKKRKAEMDKIRHANLQLDPQHRKKNSESTKTWRKLNPEKCRGYGRKWKLLHPEYIRDAARKRRLLDPEKVKAEKRRYYLANIEKAKVSGRRRVLKKYGLTPETYEELLNSQGRRCAICLVSTPSGKKGWHVDHCHKTGKVRGILCNNCNVVLGHARDEIATLQLAVAYLERTT